MLQNAVTVRSTEALAGLSPFLFEFETLPQICEAEYNRGAEVCDALAVRFPGGPSRTAMCFRAMLSRVEAGGASPATSLAIAAQS